MTDCKACRLLALAAVLIAAFTPAAAAEGTRQPPRADEAALGVLIEPQPRPPWEEDPRVVKAARLLAGFDLTVEQSAALRDRLAGDAALIAALEQGALTRQDLTFLALPNGRMENLDRYSAYAAGRSCSAEQVVLTVNMGLDRPFYTDVDRVTDPGGVGILVNKYNELPAGFVPVLEPLGGGYGSGSLRPEAARAFRAMADDARREGISLRSVSAYRSYAYQERLYRNAVSKNGLASAETFSARAGYSEHQTGLALDINAASRQDHFEDTAAYRWLIAHCAEYGFILRYPEDGRNITGYSFEPWHYRYVGEQAARACMSQNLTYEEYLALQPVW